MQKHIRSDGRKSSNYYSTMVVALVVSACLIGTWISVGLTKDVISYRYSDKYSGEFEDSPSDLPKDLHKGYVNQANVSLKKFENLGKQGKRMRLKKPSSDDDNERIGVNMRKEVVPRKGKGVKHMEENSLSNRGDENETAPRNQQNSKEYIHASKLKIDEGKEKSRVGQGSDDTKDEIDEIKNEANSWEQGSIDPDESKDARKKTAEIGFKDQGELVHEPSTQVEAWLAQTTGSDKRKVSKMLKHEQGFKWKLCNATAGSDYIPCLDNIQAVWKLPSRSHYEHLERHCPDEAVTCLVPLPEGYRTSVKWPKSRERIWFANVPHVRLVEFKGHQNWVKISGNYFTFPGGGTQFKNGAMHYIDFIQQTVPDISWGKRTRVILDVGCGVASFGGYLVDRGVLTMSLAPKDKHEAQVQFALERGIPAISAVMGTKRLPFPTMAFDVVHCARCRVPWHVDGGKLLLELNRVLRPGGYFVWSATPIYRKDPEDVSLWKAMSKLTKSMCWELLRIGKDKVNGVSIAVYRKPISNDCYESRTKNDPPLCQDFDDPNAVW